MNIVVMQKQWRELSREDQEPVSESPPPPQPPKCTERYNGSKLSHPEDGVDMKTTKKTALETPNKEPEKDAGTKYVSSVLFHTFSSSLDILVFFVKNHSWDKAYLACVRR